MPPSVTVFYRATAHTFHSLTTHGSKLLAVSTLSKSTDPSGVCTNPNTKGGKWLCKHALTVCLLSLTCQSARQLPVTGPLFVIRIIIMIVQEAKWVRQSIVTEYLRWNRVSLPLTLAWSHAVYIYCIYDHLLLQKKRPHLKQPEKTPCKTSINDYIDYQLVSLDQSDKT